MTPRIRNKLWDSRHDDDAEVQPVPGVPQEGEGAHTEPSGQDLNERLEGVDTCEGVPAGRGGRGSEDELETTAEDKYS